MGEAAGAESGGVDLFELIRLGTGAGWSEVLRANGDPTWFEFFTQIAIPSFVGFATVLLGVAALVSSSRAQRFAENVEQVRVQDAKDRLDEARHRRMLEMAQEEAKVLRKWVLVASESWNWDRTEVADTGIAYHGRTLQRDAQIELQQSLVRGAADLLALCELEVHWFRRGIPEEAYFPDRVQSRAPGVSFRSAMKESVLGWRRDRAMSRIRRWAEDPDVQAPVVTEELARARNNPSTFFDYRQCFPEAGDLRSFEDSPFIPSAEPARRDRLLEIGAISESYELPR